jgi:hypothetical protein
MPTERCGKSDSSVATADTTSDAAKQGNTRRRSAQEAGEGRVSSRVGVRVRVAPVRPVASGKRCYFCEG